jgi:hypothetical protein
MDIQSRLDELRQMDEEKDPRRHVLDMMVRITKLNELLDFEVSSFRKFHQQMLRVAARPPADFEIVLGGVLKDMRQGVRRIGNRMKDVSKILDTARDALDDYIKQQERSDTDVDPVSLALARDKFFSSVKA